jgi:hypothetical protein
VIGVDDERLFRDGEPIMSERVPSNASADDLVVRMVLDTSSAKARERR